MSHAPTPVAASHGKALTVPLDQVALATAYVVHRVASPDGGIDWPQRLEEIGFLPGEHVRVMARGQPGNEPLAVRVGHSTFALRKAEAACVHVLPLGGEETAR